MQGCLCEDISIFSIKDGDILKILYLYRNVTLLLCVTTDDL